MDDNGLQILDPDKGYMDIPERMTNKNIRSDRLVAKLKKEFGQQFARSEKDNDGNLTLEELERYTNKINADRKYDKTVLKKLYKDMDSDGDNRVSIDEFCVAYAKKIEGYEMQILECKRRSTEIRHEITDINTQKQEIAKAETMNQFGIMEGSVLIVTVCEARGLKDWELGKGIDPFVMLQCEGQRIETSYQADTYNPTWNECFTFDIKRGDDPLKLHVYDRGTFANTFIGKYHLPLESLGTQQEVQGWYDLHEENYDSENITGQIKLKIQWIYSRLGLMTDKVHSLQQHQRKIDDIRRAHERELNMLKSPFLFLFRDRAVGLDDGDPDILLSIFQPHSKELEISKGFDAAFKPLVDRTTLRDYFWQIAFVFAFFVYFLITMLLCIYKSDFFNLTIVGLSMFVLPWAILDESMNSYKAKQKIIRMCVFMIFISFFWDIAWLVLNWTDWWKGERYDGDIELGLRRFSLIATIVSLVIRIFVFIVYWRTSLSYQKFMAVDSLSGLHYGSEKVVFLRG